jgi:hypothetical protein
MVSLESHLGSLLKTVQLNKQKPFYESLEPTLRKKVFAVNLKADGIVACESRFLNEFNLTENISKHLKQMTRPTENSMSEHMW